MVPLYTEQSLQEIVVHVPLVRQESRWARLWVQVDRWRRSCDFIRCGSVEFDGISWDKDINQTPLSVDINDPIYTLNVDILGIIDL